MQPGELKDKLFIINEEDGGLSDEHITSLRRYKKKKTSRIADIQSKRVATGGERKKTAVLSREAELPHRESRVWMKHDWDEALSGSLQLASIFYH